MVIPRTGMYLLVHSFHFNVPPRSLGLTIFSFAWSFISAFILPTTLYYIIRSVDKLLNRWEYIGGHFLGSGHMKKKITNSFDKGL